MNLHLPPWTKTAMPHDDVRDDHAVKAEYAVNLGKIDRGDKAVTRNYADPRAFFEATYLTPDLRRLLADTMAALSGKKVDRVLQLRTPFGGGKSHTLVALYHLAKSRPELGAIADLKGMADPGAIRLAVLACADLTPGEPRKIKGGPTIRTLWGELAYRLGGAEGYDAVRRIDETPSAPGGELIEGLLRGSKQAPVLLLADEVLVYVEKAMAVPAGDSTLGRQTLTFLQALTESVAGAPNAALVYSLQASIGEAVGAEGLLQVLDKLVGRVDARRVPVQAEHIREIVRRRLFKSLGDSAVREQVATAYAEEHRRFLLAGAESAAERTRAEEDAKHLHDDILGAYPFHPSLIQLMYERWGSLQSYQRTRGALQFLGTLVHVLFKRGHGGALIAPTDVPFDDPDVRNEFFRQIGERERWDSVLDADLASERARARSVDRSIGEASPGLMQARVGTATATAITLFSFGARKDELRGVLQQDLVRACLRPDVEAPTIVSALGQLRESLLYLHVAGGRYRMDTIPSLTKLIEEAYHVVDGDDVAARVRKILEEQIGKASSALLWPADAGRIPDGTREFLFAYLPLEWAENDPERNEAGARVLLLARAGGEKGGKRRFKNGVAFVLPQKSYADQARHLARRQKALEALKQKAKQKQIDVSAEQVAELEEKLTTAGKDLVSACRSLYGQVLLPVAARGKDAKDAEGDVEEKTPIAFRTIDVGTLAAGTDLHSRLLELLKKQVYTDLSVERFAEITRLGSAGGPTFVPMGDAIDAFFSFLDYPKMRSDAPLLAALAGAVEKRLLGYVPEAKLEGDTLVLPRGTRVRFGSRYGGDEFAGEADAYLVSAEYAQKLTSGASVPPSVAPVVEEDGKAPPEKKGEGHGAGWATPQMPTPLPIAEPVGKGEKGSRYALTATAKGKQQWYALGAAVNKLVGVAGEVTVKVVVEAKRAEGFDPVWVANSVKEVLEEKDVEFNDGMGKD